MNKEENKQYLEGNGFRIIEGVNIAVKNIKRWDMTYCIAISLLNSLEYIRMEIEFKYEEARRFFKS